MSEQEVKALLVRAFKTFAQAFVAVFLLGLTPVISSILQTGSFSGAKAAVLALVSASLAAGLSAVMNLRIRPVEAK
jgi:hypothetical protein